MKTGALMGDRAYADRGAARQMPLSMPLAIVHAVSGAQMWLAS
jgi:hypothetical protein